MSSWSPDRWVRPLRIAFPALLAGCGPSGDPVVLGEAGGAGYWPANSPTAVYGAIEAELAGMELDVALTADDVPVLGRPWLEPAACTLADGSPLAEPIAVRTLLLTELREHLCGGLPDPAHPNAVLVAEPPMTLAELLVALKSADPRMIIQLDLHAEPADVEPLAAAVLDRWFAADRAQPWFLTSPRNEDLAAFVAYGRQQGRHVPVSVTWPEDEPEVRLGSELRAGLGLDSLRTLVEEHAADGLQLHWAHADRAEVHALRREGLRVGLWTLNDPDLVPSFRDWPVDLLVSAYPGDAP